MITKKHKAYISFSQKEASKIKEILNTTNSLTEKESIIYNAVFSDGKQMDIKICGAEDDRPWTEAVLFSPQGFQLAYSEPEDYFFGSWQIEYTDNDNTVSEYTVYISEEHEFNYILDLTIHKDPFHTYDCDKETVVFSVKNKIKNKSQIDEAVTDATLIAFLYPDASGNINEQQEKEVKKELSERYPHAAEDIRKNNFATYSQDGEQISTVISNLFMLLQANETDKKRYPLIIDQYFQTEAAY